MIIVLLYAEWVSGVSLCVVCEQRGGAQGIGGCKPKLNGFRRRHAPRLGARHAVRVYALRNFDFPEALLIDANGVLIEAERDVRRIALNTALKKQVHLALV